MVARWVWVWVKMCQVFETLRCNSVVTALYLVSCSRFLPWKDLRRNLDYHLRQVGNMWTKVFLLFSGSESTKVLTISCNDPCRRLFQIQPPLPSSCISRVFDPPPTRMSRILSVVGVWIFFGITQWYTITVEPWYFKLAVETKNYSKQRESEIADSKSEGNIQGKKLWVRNNREFKITEFELSGSNCI